MLEDDPVALIVEDDLALSYIFSEAVKLAGYHTQVCLTGSAALKAFQEPPIRLVVLDLHLPDAQGSELLHNIRSLPHLRDTQVVIATADPLMAELYQDEADFVLIKPISFVQLSALAKRLL